MSWHLITQGSGQNSNYMEFLLDSDSDIETPPTEMGYAMSSIAHTPGYAKIWEADSSGQWVEIGSDGAMHRNRVYCFGGGIGRRLVGEIT